MASLTHSSFSPHLVSIYNAIDSVSEELRSLSLKIHSHPELGLSEFKAHAWLTEYLATKGFRMQQSASGLQTAFIAHAGHARPQTIIGVCSEYDALPGIGHACGHNLIAIAGVATAIGIKTVIEQFGLQAQVKLFGTPSEEHDAGKVSMFDSGDFRGVDVCMMLHGANVDVIHTPFLALNTADVEFFGKASHASASPWEGTNALDAAVVSYTNIGLMRQQIKPDQRVHGIIMNGGQASNIIPAYTKSAYTVRAPKFAQMKELMVRVQTIFESAAEATGCTVKIEWGTRIHGKYLKDIMTNGPLAERFELAMSDLGLKYASKEEQHSKISGSTDMGNLTYEMPGIHPMFNIMNLEGADDHSTGLHTVEFAAAAAYPVGHTATLRASKALAVTGLECILDPVFLKRVKDSFAEQVKAP